MVDGSWACPMCQESTPLGFNRHNCRKAHCPATRPELSEIITAFNAAVNASETWTTCDVCCINIEQYKTSVVSLDTPFLEPVTDLLQMHQSSGLQSDASCRICNACMRQLKEKHEPAFVRQTVQIGNPPECFNDVWPIERLVLAHHVPVVRVTTLPVGGQKAMQREKHCMLYSNPNLPTLAEQLPRAATADLILNVAITDGTQHRPLSQCLPVRERCVRPAVIRELLQWLIGGFSKTEISISISFFVSFFC